MITIIKTRALTFQKFQTVGKVYFSSLLVILGLVFGILLSASTMAENASELQVLQGNSQFTNKMYKLLSQEKGNIIFSPISIHAVLSMAFQGALGSTAERFASTLQVPEAKTAAEGYSEVMKRLNSVENVTLLMANKVFLMAGCKLLSGFETAVTKNFQSEVQLVDFAKTEAAAKTINDWVEVKTNEKIKDLIKKEDLDDLTRLVLVNAIYFKGNWKNKFNKEDTKTEPFYLNDVDTVDVQMMHTKKKFNYKVDQALDAQILEMPYINEDLSMIIILPNQKNGIAELEKKLENYNLSEITQNMWNTEVNVALPKFKIEQTIDLEDSLTKLGLGEIFDQEKANFKGMIELRPGENLYVSKVVQKAFIEVNEEGAEAAAATGMIMAVDSLMVHLDLFFIADHSFILLLNEKSKKTTNTLLTGKVLKPQLYT
ncbi:serine protease inhibitor 3/4-like isoform X5 [Tribolium madens]|uniref:serine protease inhibitor 3/4-like isoform X5 n=1 Tax=Tribolium madens TaxID=41895 RepID=UPI001CF73B17|nr:serine protease inhibitor 3/4-like isoform X5 [Tribolium madens]